MIQLILNTLIMGSIYALIASGFSIIYSTNRFMHLAHGASVVLSAYLFFEFFSHSVPLAILIGIFIGAASGWLMYRCIYHPLMKRNASKIILLIASVSLLLLLENLVALIFGSGVKVNSLVKPQLYSIGSATISSIQILIIVTATILFCALVYLMRATAFGRKLRAVADNQELAEVSGIDTQRIIEKTFIIGSTIAGIAGIMLALEQTLTPGMGLTYMIKSITASIIGGIYSVPGSILGSYLLSTVETIGVWHFSASYKDVISFTLLFVFLLMRPQGILGEKQ